MIHGRLLAGANGREGAISRAVCCFCWTTVNTPVLKHNSSGFLCISTGLGFQKLPNISRSLRLE